MKDETPKRITPVILSGGIGTRLWPLSRRLRPKQFLSLLEQGQSLFGASLDRVKEALYAPPIILCSYDHRFLVVDELREAELRDAEIILEPVSRNTAFAITIAALRVSANNPESLMLVTPSDHVIANSEEFAKTVLRAESLATEGMLVTFGILPTRPETGYGYIKCGLPVGDGFMVDRFIEKPEQAKADKYIKNKDYYWNAGIFVFRADVYLSEIQKFSPEILSAAKSALGLAEKDFEFLKLYEGQSQSSINISIDVAVMEKTEMAAVVPVQFDWKDVGSLLGLSEMGVKDAAGNVCVGDSLLIDSNDNYIHTEKPLVAVLGIDEIALVATDDVVLAVPKSRSQDVQRIVSELQSQNRQELVAHTIIYRPWGHYLNVDSGDGYLVKQIFVNPGAKLSLQHHNYRAEHWVVVEGVARVTNGEKVFDLHSNQSTFIPVGAKHRLENLTDKPLRLIEVQTGQVISEDDIVREVDTYGRM